MPLPSRFKNTAAESVPQFGLMAVGDITVDSDFTTLEISKPATATIDKAHIVNISDIVPQNQYGEFWNDGGMFPVATPVSANYDIGTAIGPKDGSWLAHDDGEQMFEVVGRIGTKNIHLVKSLGGGGSKIALVQAPVGGIPARVGKTPGVANCAAIVKATVAGTGYAVGDYVLNGQTYSIDNWTFEIVGASGDRMVEVSGHFDGALVVGFICGNSASSFFNTQNPLDPGDP